MTEHRPAVSYRKPGFWRRLRQGNLSDRQLGYVLLSPALATLALVMLYPVLTVLWQSIHGEHLLRPWVGSPLVGAEHFEKMLCGPGDELGAVHLWPWRALGLALLIPTWWAVARKRTGVWAGMAISAALLAVFALAMGFHPGADGRWATRASGTASRSPC
ncbi:MAG: hypothetical protein U5K81_00030 [Trueperaceae bacterium]|nr:hypothetical protein [Trueperaceae bacterium]